MLFFQQKNPKTSIREALAHPEWRRAMVEEKEALKKNGTWELVPLPEGKGPTYDGGEDDL